MPAHKKPTITRQERRANRLANQRKMTLHGRKIKSMAMLLQQKRDDAGKASKSKSS